MYLFVHLSVSLYPFVAQSISYWCTCTCMHVFVSVHLSTFYLAISPPYPQHTTTYSHHSTIPHHTITHHTIPHHTNSHITSSPHPHAHYPHHTPQVNGHQVSREKPSAVKKLLKPHKNVLQLVIERVKKTNNDTGQALSPFQSEEWNEEEYGQRGSTALSADSTLTYRRWTQVSTETPSQGSPSTCIHTLCK